MSAEASHKLASQKPASPFQEWPAAIAGACERLVHPSVDEPAERQRQFRLLSLLFTAPFFGAVIAAQLLSWPMGVALTLAVVCGIFSLTWGVASLLLATGRRKAVEALSLLLGGCFFALVVVAAGGPASPLALVTGVVALEAGWVAKSRRAWMVGGIVAGLALFAGSALALLMPGNVPGLGNMPSVAHWVVPVLYGASLWLRHGAHASARECNEDEAEPQSLEQRIDAIVLHMDNSGEVSRASRQAKQLMGVQPDILLGQGLFDRIHVADRVAYLCAIADMRDKGRASPVRIRFRMPAGENAHGAPGFGHFSVAFLANMAPGVHAAIIRDDEERAEMEAVAEATKAHALGVETESRRVMAAVSHELRTPLNAILGFTDTLTVEMFGPFADERQREYVKLIHQAGEHLLSVANATLEVSKLDSGAYIVRREIFDFEEVVRSSLALVGPQAAAKFISMQIAVCQDVGTVHCDRQALQQVLINLLSNAVKFTPDHGKITVDAKRTGRRLDFSVSDTGLGIAAEDLENIGQPFVRFRKADTSHIEGTGLGLSLVKGLIELQGGGLSIESALGEGTQVSVSLPVGEPAGDKAQNKDEPEQRGKLARLPVKNDEWTDEEYRKTA